MNCKNIGLIVATFCCSIGFAQTGPGGVGTNVTAPFWLDAHTMGGSNGSAVTTWTDYSGNGNDATEADPTDQPFYITNSVNGRNAIDFQGSQCLTAGAESQLDNLTKFKFFCVADVDNAAPLSLPFNIDYGPSGADAAFSGVLTQSGAMDVYGHKHSSLIRADLSSPSGVHIYGGTYDMGTGELTGETDFVVDDVNSNLLRNTSAHEEFWIGGTNSFGASHYFFDGQIAEIFVYSTDINSTQQNILENYISAKYGIAATTDMYTLQANHGLGVVGIGQESGGDSHTDSQGNGVVRINTPDDLNDGEYLFVGHDDVELTSFNLSTNVPTSLSGSQRFTRQWRAEKTGDLGNITLIFDLDPTINYSGDPDSYSLLIDGDTDMSGTVDHILTGTYNAGDETVTFTNVDLQTGDFFTLVGDAPAIITSINTGDWSETTTWDCGCIPTCFSEVLIEAPHNVNVDEDAFVYDFYVEGKLTMDAEFDLSIYGSTEIDGDLELSAGKIVMAGSSDQTFDCLGGSYTLHDFEVNNTTGSTVTLSPATLSLEGSLLMEKGDLVIDNTSGGILIIASDAASGGGRIGEIKPACTITGNVRVDRFLAAGNADYRNLTSPISNGTLAMWDNSILISGEGFPDGCAYGVGGCFYSVKSYYSGAYHDVTDINTTLDPGAGYEVFIGDDLATWAGGSVSVTGTPHPEGDLVVNVSFDWNSLGNPYSSPILFSNVARNHVDNYFYIYDASTGGYQWYDGASNTASIPELNNGLLASGQGFWTFDYGFFTFDQTDKVDQNATFIRSSESGDKGIYFTVRENASTYETTISFEEHPDTEDGFDTIRDVRHLNLRDAKCPNIAIKTFDDLLRKNWINSDVREKSFDIYSSFQNEGYYTFESSNIEGFDNYNKIYLLDLETGKFIDLTRTPEYVFHTDAGEFDRFKILFSNEAEDLDGKEINSGMQETVENLTIIQMGHVIDISSEEFVSENAEVSVFNLLGQEEVFFTTTAVMAGSNIITVPSSVKGVHLFSINFNGKRITKKLVF